LYARNNDPTSAEENILKAVAILRKLADEQENVPNFQGDLARGLIVLGEVRRSANQFDQAETAYRDAALIQEKLARQFAESTHYAFGVASTHHQLGQLLGENKKYDKAGESFLNALTWWQQLAKQNPAEVDFAAGQALTQRNLGDLAILAKNPKEAADWYDRAIGAMEPVVVKNPDSTKAKNALWRAYWKRADLRTQLGQFGDALEDWNRVVVLVPDDYAGRGMRLKRAAALARAGKPADAVSEADKLLKHPVYAEGYYLIAGVYALAAGAAENDVARSPEERKAFADKYAARAVKFLTVARDEKFFETPSNLKRISADPDLNVLRDRSDFQKLLKALKK
jgi:tetratricopeptide (TPR) repeat protein